MAEKATSRFYALCRHRGHFNTKIEELKGILLNECNFDVAAEFAACNEERRGEYDKMRVVQ